MARKSWGEFQWFTGVHEHGITRVMPDDEGKTNQGLREIAPNPGSHKAIRSGCLCPVTDNHYGRGQPHQDSVLFWTEAECPMHGAIDNRPLSMDNMCPNCS